MSDSHAHEHEDAMLDEALEETFPASDAPANTVETGIAIGDVPPAANVPAIDQVVDNKARDRFELAVNDAMAFLLYKRTHGALALIHTEVPEAVRGRRAGETLVEAALRTARLESLRIIPICPFAKAYIRRHSIPLQAGGAA